MSNPAHIDIFKQGPTVWNTWREENPNIKPDLSDINFESDVHTYESFYDTPQFEDYDLSKMQLNRIVARNSHFFNCDFSGSHMSFSDLCFSSFQSCDFSSAVMAVTKIGSASFNSCDFTKSDLSYCSAEDTDFSDSKFILSKLSNMSLVKANFSNTIIDRARVYGISAWDLDLTSSDQKNIYILEEGTNITVPSIELAQFISLLINNTKIRDFIDTITSKMVLILGRFTPERKIILDELKNELQRRDYLPVIFDFEGPTNRDVGETIISLASLSKFVIADISSPKSIPQELESIVPKFPSLPIQPLIDDNQIEYGMFNRFSRYPWVQEKVSYSRNEIVHLVDVITSNCENYISNDK